MNLSLSMLGWLHTLCCLYAMWIGARVAFSFKGGQQHRARGKRYVMASIVLNLTALGIYTVDGFRIFHAMALVTLASVLLAFAAARWKRPQGAWLRVHLTAIIFSYYMLWGGAVNEAFLRVHVLKALPYANAAMGIAHTLLMVLLLVYVGYCWGKTARSPVASGAGQPVATIF